MTEESRHTKIRKRVLNALYPFTTWVGNVHMPYSRKLMTAGEYHQFVKIAKPGDVFITHTNGEFTNLFIPGFWSHAAIYCPDSHSTPCVVEAVGKGVVHTDLINFLMTKDHVLLLRPTFATNAERLHAAKLAETLVGRPYDYEFRSDNKAFYCAEVIWYVYDKIAKGKCEFTMRETLGELTVLPNDLANAAQKWQHLRRNSV